MLCVPWDLARSGCRSKEWLPDELGPTQCQWRLPSLEAPWTLTWETGTTMGDKKGGSWMKRTQNGTQSVACSQDSNYLVFFVFEVWFAPLWGQPRHAHNRLETVVEKEIKQSPQQRMSAEGMDPNSMEASGLAAQGSDLGGWRWIDVDWCRLWRRIDEDWCVGCGLDVELLRSWPSSTRTENPKRSDEPSLGKGFLNYFCSKWIDIPLCHCVMNFGRMKGMKTLPILLESFKAKYHEILLNPMRILIITSNHEKTWEATSPRFDTPMTTSQELGLD